MSKSIILSVIDGSTCYKINQVTSSKFGKHQSRIDFKSLSANLALTAPNPIITKNLYFYSNKISEGQNLLDVKASQNTFLYSIARYGWEINEVNPDEIVVFKPYTAAEKQATDDIKIITEYFDKRNFNISASIKSIYQESGIAMMKFQALLEDYYYNIDYDGCDIVANFIVYNDNYILPIKNIIKMYPEVKINVYSSYDRINFLENSFFEEECVNIIKIDNLQVETEEQVSL